MCNFLPVILFFKAFLVLLKFGMLQKMELRMGINTVSIVMYWMQFIWKLFIISFLILLRCGCFSNKIYIYLKQFDLLLQVNANISILYDIVHMLKLLDVLLRMKRDMLQCSHLHFIIYPNKKKLFNCYKWLCVCGCKYKLITVLKAVLNVKDWT